MVAKLSLSLLVAVLLALRCLGNSDGAFKLVHAVEDGNVLLECRLPSPSSPTSSKAAVKQLRLTKASQLVFERNGQFPASLGNGYFHRLSLVSLSQRLHQFNLTSLTETDEGSYTCRLELENGESGTEIFRLQLWLLPRFESNNYSASPILYRQPGEYIVLRCPKFRGRPQPSVTWLINERRLTNRGRVRIDPLLPNQLQVYNLNIKDSGRYACRIESAYGIREFDFTLLVGASNSDGRTASPIAFIQRPPPSQATASEGDRLELPCGYYADPRLRVRVAWQRTETGSNWSTLSTLSDDSIVLVAQNSSLIFLPLDHSHSGIYRCLVILTKANGSEQQLTSRSSAIVVLHPPTLLINASRTQFLPLGQSGTLTCPVIANPPVGATDWSRDGSPIGAAFVGRRYRFNLVTPSHAGSYRCRVLQTASRFNSWSTWTPEFVVRTVQPPRFVTRPLPLYQISPGESTRLPCAFWSPPDVPTSLIWLRNGQRLDYRDRRLAYDPLSQSLSVRNIQPDLAGIYTCLLDNPVAQLAAKARLQVEHVSPHPPSNLTVVGVTSYSLDIEWQPAFVAGHTIKYVIWFRRLGSAWQSQLAEPPTATEATINGLVADAVYELSLTSLSSDGSSKEMRVQPESTTARTNGYSPQLAEQPLPRDRSGRPVFPPIERDLGPRPGQPEAAAFEIISAGILRLTWRPPTRTLIPVLYYRLEVNVWDGKDVSDNEGNWEAFKQVLEPRASLPIDALPLLRVRAAEAAATRRRLRIAATACALLSRSQRVVVADVDPRQLPRLLPAGSVAAAVAAAGVSRVPAGAAWALLSCLLSFLVLAGALLGLTRSSGRSLGRRVIIVNGGNDCNEKIDSQTVREAAPALRRRASHHRSKFRRHICRSRRCCCRQQLVGASGVFGASGVSSEHPVLLSSRYRHDRPASDPESGFHTLSCTRRGVCESNDDDDVLDANDDEVSVSDIESTLPPGSWQVHGWSRRLPISVYLASYHRIRRLRRASFPVYRESDLL